MVGQCAKISIGVGLTELVGRSLLLECMVYIVRQTPDIQDATDDFRSTVRAPTDSLQILTIAFSRALAYSRQSTQYSARVDNTARWSKKGGPDFRHVRLADVRFSLTSPPLPPPLRPCPADYLLPYANALIHTGLRCNFHVHLTPSGLSRGRALAFLRQPVSGI